jgi:chromosome segregation ATPase
LEEEQLKELEDIRDRIERESEDSRLKQSSELHSAKEQLRQRSNELDQLELEIASLQKTESRLKQELNTKDHTIIEQ